MGYYVKARPEKKAAPHWKVQFISFRKEDTAASKAKKPKREWDINRSRWPALGFNVFMTLDEARARAKQLNAQQHLRRQEEEMRRIERSQEGEQRRYKAFLPSEFAAEFELRFIRKRDSQTEQGLRKNTRAYVAWRAAQRMIVAVGVEPSEWFCHTYRIYDYFHVQRMSLRYLSTVLKIANLWGFFISRKLARPFLPVPIPRGYERQRIVEANFEKKRVARPSKPITPENLERARQCRLNQANLNWLFLSVWFGLRPKEVDGLHKKILWRLEVLPTGRQILWVYQTKIISAPPEDRWKPIPILFDEQRFALRILESGVFKRPIRLTMVRYFGPGVTLYAGRKGFSDLMLSRGQSFWNISVWMGHSTIQRTWRSYKSRRKFHIDGY